MTGRIRPVPDDVWAGVWAASVTLTASCTALIVGPSVVFGVLLGPMLFAAMVWGFIRAPHVMFASAIVLFVTTPALKFFVATEAGALKDVVVLSAIAATILVGSDRLRACDRWILVAAGGIVLLYILNVSGGHGSAWFYGGRVAVEALALFMAGYLLRRPARSLRWASVALVAAAVGIATFGLVQQAVGWRALVVDWGYTYGEQVRQITSGQFRSFGTLDEPFNYAAILLLSLSVLGFLKWRTRWIVAIGAVLVVGIAASYVRSAIVIVAGLIVVLLIVKRQPAIAVSAGIAAVLAGVLLFGLVPQSNPTVSQAQGGGDNFLLTLNGRTSAWSEVLGGPTDWLAGRGVGDVGTGATRSQYGVFFRPGQQPDANAQSGAEQANVLNIDSSYLAITADIGLVGLGFLALLLLRSIRVLSLATRRGEAAGWIGIAVLVVLLLDGMTRSSLTAFPAGFVGLSLVGLAVAASEESGRSMTRGNARRVTQFGLPSELQKSETSPVAAGDPAVAGHDNRALERPGPRGAAVNDGNLVPAPDRAIGYGHSPSMGAEVEAARADLSGLACGRPVSAPRHAPPSRSGVRNLTSDAPPVRPGASVGASPRRRRTGAVGASPTSAPDLLATTPVRRLSRPGWGRVGVAARLRWALPRDIKRANPGRVRPGLLYVFLDRLSNLHRKQARAIEALRARGGGDNESRGPGGRAP